MKAIKCFLLITLTISAIAQEKKEKTDLRTIEEIWSSGSIMTTSGEELKGMIRYDDRNELVAYAKGENTRSFSPRSVVGFEFFDERQQKQRMFLVLDEIDPATDVKRSYFFEVLREFSDFAVLLKIDRAGIEEKKTATPGVADVGHITGIKGLVAQTIVTQKETVYFMSSDGKLTPYVQFITKDVEEWKALKADKKKGKYIDGDVMAKFVSESVFKKIKAYASEHDLHFKNKSDFMQILDYYTTLTGQGK